MMMNDIQNLLDQVKLITDQNEVLLDATGGRFNVFQVCGVNHYEITHTKIIAEFLNPNGSHGLKSKLLKCFIETLGDKFVINDFKHENASVTTEHWTGQNGQIDILIEDENNHALIIENKIYAGDQNEQLKRYNNFAEKKYGKGNYMLVYLSLDGKEASPQSCDGVDYTRISYKDDIITWLEKCACIAIHLSTVRETIIQYANHIKSLANLGMNKQYQDKIVNLLAKPENLKSVAIIENNLNNIKGFVRNKIIIARLIDVCKNFYDGRGKIKLENIQSEYDYSITAHYTKAGFHITNSLWTKFQIGYQCHDPEESIIGIIPKPDDENNRKDESVKKVFDHFNMKNNYWAYFKRLPFSWWSPNSLTAICEDKVTSIFKKEIEDILLITEGLAM